MQKRGIAPFTHDAAQGSHQFRSGQAQFVVVVKREFAEDFLAFRCERQQDFAAIIPGSRAMHKPSRFEAVHQFHRAVVADLHAIGQFADARPHPGRHAFNRQHQLILSALEPCLLDHLFAEVKKAADLIPEFR